MIYFINKSTYMKDCVRGNELVDQNAVYYNKKIKICTNPGFINNFNGKRQITKLNHTFLTCYI